MTTGGRRRFAGTIWDRKFLEEVPERYRSLYTTIIPLKYLSIGMFGLCYLSARAPGVVAQFTSAGYSDLWALAVTVLVALSLIGLVFRREGLELVSTILLTAGLATYPIANFWVGLDRWNLSQIAVGFALMTLLWIPSWRVFDIVRTSRRRGA